MAKIPFTLDAWLKDKSQKIETRNGRPVHYIGLDRAGWQVFEVFRTNGTSEYRTYHDSYLYSGPGESTFDLFIVTPEEEMSEFEKEYFRLYKEGYADGQAGSEQLSNAVLKDSASELLSLARDQFIKDGYVFEKKAFHDAVENISDKNLAEMSVQYSIHCKVEDGTRHAIMNWNTFQKVAQKFIDIGKAEALKDLPRWKKCDPNSIYNTKFNFIVNGVGRYIVLDGYMINVDRLEKLPGFNE